MKEKEFINTIKTVLNSKYIGDDCAYLEDLGIVVTQDSLVEDVHFKRCYITPYQLGWKSAMVNISDICASGAKPVYLTVSLSLPKDITTEFVEEFYKGLKDAAGNAQIVGGDITGSDRIFISITAIGSSTGRNISSRKNARIGQKIIVSGQHGASAAGLKDLIAGKKDSKFIHKHLMPEARLEFSKKIAVTEKSAYAMMDTSDGLMDALSQIAENSKVMAEVDFTRIPYDKELEQYENYRDLIFYGGEDYELIASVDNPQDFTVIGEIKAGEGITILNLNGKTVHYTKEDIEKNLYNHFKEQ